MANKIASGIIHGIIVYSNKPFCKMVQRDATQYIMFIM